jgi:hypothetical protein
MEVLVTNLRPAEMDIDSYSADDPEGPCRPSLPCDPRAVPSVPDGGCVRALGGEGSIETPDDDDDLCDRGLVVGHCCGRSGVEG